MTPPAHQPTSTSTTGQAKVSGDLSATPHNSTIRHILGAQNMLETVLTNDELEYLDAAREATIEQWRKGAITYVEMVYWLYANITADEQKAHDENALEVTGRLGQL
jgi:hypothetical protein